MKVRRPEFKRARAYRQRKHKRYPLGRLLRDVYSDMRSMWTLPIMRPLPSFSSPRWGANVLYFDVVTSPTSRPADYAGHSVIGSSASELRQGGVGPRFYTNPFVKDAVMEIRR